MPKVETVPDKGIPFGSLVDPKKGVITANRLAAFIWPDLGAKKGGRRLRSFLRDAVFTDDSYTRYAWNPNDAEDRQDVEAIVAGARKRVGRAAQQSKLSPAQRAKLIGG